MNELVVRSTYQQEYGMDLTSLAEHLTRSRFFKDCTDVSKAVTKIMLGKSMGIDPTNSMMGIFINAQGKLSLSANLMANRIKASGRYRWKLTKHDAKVCEGIIYEKIDNQWVEIGQEKVVIDDFKHLTTEVWKKYPKNMLFARWISNVAKFYTPDAFGGSAVYLPDEIPNSGLKVDGETLEVVVEDVEYKNKVIDQYNELVTDLGLTAKQLAFKLAIDEKVLLSPTEEEAKKIIPKLTLLKGIKDGNTGKQ